MKINGLLRLRAISVIALVAMTLIGTGYARASKQGSDVAAVAGSMNVDCARVLHTPAAQALLAKYNLCGYGVAGGIRPDYGVCGDCGCITAVLFDNNNGSATSFVQITSRFGPLFAASYSATWLNFNSNGSGSFGDSTGPTGSPWTSNKRFQPGSGYVQDTVSATSLTAIGTCQGTTGANVIVN